MLSEFDGVSGDAKGAGESETLSVFPPSDSGDTAGESGGIGSGLEATTTSSYGGGPPDEAEEEPE